MRKVTTFLLLFAICVSQFLWAHNYCMNCVLGSSTTIEQTTQRHQSCCSSRSKVQTKQNKCTSCGDNCKCSSLETEDKLNHSLVSFDFSLTVDYISQFIIPISITAKSLFTEKVYPKRYFNDSAPPPLLHSVLSKTILLI